MPALTTLLSALLAAGLGGEPPVRPTPGTPPPEGVETTHTVETTEVPPPRPEDKTLVASLDVVQGEGKERVSLYRDGTLALVRTYTGVRTLKKKLLSEEEVDLIRRVCAEAEAVAQERYEVDVLGSAEPRRFRIEIGRDDAPPKVFTFDELARVPLVLGRARGALEGLLERFDENVVSSEDLWDPSVVKSGDVLTRRKDGRRYRVARDDAFVRSLELVDEERHLERLFVLREEVPKLFLDPSSEEGGGKQP